MKNKSSSRKNIDHPSYNTKSFLFLVFPRSFQRKEGSLSKLYDCTLRSRQPSRRRRRRRRSILAKKSANFGLFLPETSNKSPPSSASFHFFVQNVLERGIKGLSGKLVWKTILNRKEKKKKDELKKIDRYQFYYIEISKSRVEERKREREKRTNNISFQNRIEKKEKREITRYLPYKLEELINKRSSKKKKKKVKILRLLFYSRGCSCDVGGWNRGRSVRVSAPFPLSPARHVVLAVPWKKCATPEEDAQ